LGATRIENGNLSDEVVVSSQDEFGTLTKSFNSMMSTLQKSIHKSNNAMNELQSLNQHLEDRVKERTARLELSQKIAQMGQWDCELGGRFIHISSEINTIFGFSDKRVITRHQLFKSIYLDDRMALINAYYKTIKHQIPFRLELRIVRPDGQIRFITISARVDLNNTTKMLFGIAQDISEHKRAEESARRALIEKTNAESANNAKSAFLANMSHEIRTPLTAIIGFSEMLLAKKQNNNDDKESLNTIFKNSKHLLQVINEILDFSKIESEKLDIEVLPIVLTEILSDLESVMKLNASIKEIDFKLVIDYPIPKIIHSDPTRLKQILFNLVNNAIKFTDQGYVQLSIGYNSTNSSIEFDIIDTGIGIERDKLNLLFTPFTQADSSTTRKHGGTGLGLYISKRLIEKLGGDIQIESIKDLGTKLHFKINAGEIDPSSLLRKPYKQQILQTSESRSVINQPLLGSILLVDDSPDNRKLVSALLSSHAVDIAQAENGKQAIEISLANEFDLILMDIQMPIMDGVEATKWLRSTGYKKPIIALTANAMKEEQERYLEAGCDDFLSKPIDQSIFFKILNKYIGASIQKPKTKNIEMNNDLVLLEKEFVDSLTERMELITNGFSQQDFELIKSESHKLKGIAGAYGYNEITASAGKIESAIKSSNPDIAKTELTVLIELCQNAIKLYTTKYALDYKIQQGEANG